MKKLYDFIGAGMDIMESVPCALVMVDLVDGHSVRCVIFCANLGGDADAIGAMAGAISGKRSLSTVNRVINSGFIDGLLMWIPVLDYLLLSLSV
nr:ADP-ribosylglycohydrolase family protein [Photorhabdus stackebrandtii]